MSEIYIFNDTINIFKENDKEEIFDQINFIIGECLNLQNRMYRDEISSQNK